MSKGQTIFAPTAMAILIHLFTSNVNAANPACYTLASLEGSWAVTATYRANVALAMGQRYVDRSGNFTSVFVLNGPIAGSPTGERTITTGTQTGTYMVNCDGTGTITRTLTASNGVVTTQVDDFMITAATVKQGQFIATAIVDAVRVPSALVPGGIFVTRVHSHLPDRPGPTQP